MSCFSRIPYRFWKPMARLKYFSRKREILYKLLFCGIKPIKKVIKMIWEMVQRNPHMLAFVCACLFMAVTLIFDGYKDKAK